MWWRIINGLPPACAPIGIKPSTSWCSGQHSNQPSHMVRAGSGRFKRALELDFWSKKITPQPACSQPSCFTVDEYQPGAYSGPKWRLIIGSCLPKCSWLAGLLHLLGGRHFEMTCSPPCGHRGPFMAPLQAPCRGWQWLGHPRDRKGQAGSVVRLGLG